MQVVLGVAVCHWNTDVVEHDLALRAITVAYLDPFSPVGAMPKYRSARSWSSLSLQLDRIGPQPDAGYDSSSQRSSQGGMGRVRPENILGQRKATRLKPTEARDAKRCNRKRSTDRFIRESKQGKDARRPHTAAINRIRSFARTTSS